MGSNAPSKGYFPIEAPMKGVPMKWFSIAMTYYIVRHGLVSHERIEPALIIDFGVILRASTANGGDSQGGSGSRICRK